MLGLDPRAGLEKIQKENFFFFLADAKQILRTWDGGNPLPLRHLTDFPTTPSFSKCFWLCLITKFFHFRIKTQKSILSGCWENCCFDDGVWSAVKHMKSNKNGVTRHSSFRACSCNLSIIYSKFSRKPLTEEKINAQCGHICSFHTSRDNPLWFWSSLAPDISSMLKISTQSRN